MSKIIKCMFFVLLAAVLPLSVHAQQVTLHLQDVTVRKAFRELEVKGNVSLVYEKNDVDLTRKVTMQNLFHDGGFSSVGMSLRAMATYEKGLDEYMDENGNIIYG